MRFLILLPICAGCAFGINEQPTEVYGHHTPESYDGGSTPSNDTYENDMYNTGCFIQNVWGPNGQADPPVGYVVICNGRPFSAQDLIDPPPNDYK